MLSVLLGCAFFSRQFWGWLADRIGGLRTILAASAFQATAMTGFLLTQNEFGLFTVSALFGLGFGGLIPAYVLAVRELFPSPRQAGACPCMLLFSGSGMAVGGWLAGWIYDHAGFYAAAFATGLGFNLVNLLVVFPLVLQWRHSAGGVRRAETSPARRERSRRAAREGEGTDRTNARAVDPSPSPLTRLDRSPAQRGRGPCLTPSR